MSRTRHHLRKRLQIWPGRLWPNYSATPSAWTRLMMNRPARRQAHLLERVCAQGILVDRIYWPLARKPRICYW